MFIKKGKKTDTKIDKRYRYSPNNLGVVGKNIVLQTQTCSHISKITIIYLSRF